MDDEVRDIVESANDTWDRDFVVLAMLALSGSLTADVCNDTTLMPMLVVVCEGWYIYVSIDHDGEGGNV